MEKVNKIIVALRELWIHNSFWRTLIIIGSIAVFCLLTYTLGKEIGKLFHSF